MCFFSFCISVHQLALSPGFPDRNIDVSESNPNDNIIMMHNGLIVKFISFIIEITFIMHLIAEVNRLVKSNLVSLEVFLFIIRESEAFAPV